MSLLSLLSLLSLTSEFPEVFEVSEVFHVNQVFEIFEIFVSEAMMIPFWLFMFLRSLRSLGYFRSCGFTQKWISTRLLEI